MPILSAIQIARVVTLLRGGGVVAIPTDTVYGLAALPTSERGVDRIVELKVRAADQPIAVLFDTLEAVRPYLADPGVLERVAPHWPGALTAVVRARQGCGLVRPVLAGTGTIGIRQPNHEVARSIIRGCGGVLAVTSANRHGEAPAITAREVAAVFGDDVVVLDGGTTLGGLASTVVDLASDPPRVLREGPVTAAALGLA